MMVRFETNNLRKKHIMKRITFLLAGLLLAANANAGVSVSVGQPGFFGQIEIGDSYPAPRVLYPQPVIIQPAQVQYEPLYLHVPPGHAKNWRKYCGRYEACGRPVYFVRDDWYNNTYAPRYREYHERGDDGRRYDRDDHGDKHGRGHDDGPGRGHDRH